MEHRHRVALDLRKRIKEVILLLLGSDENKAPLSEISKTLRCDESLLRLEIISQIEKYPAITYDSPSGTLTLSNRSLQLMHVIRTVAKQIRKSFFVPGRFEGMLYELGAKSQFSTEFWDKIHTLMFSCDLLSRFLLCHFLGTAVKEFGPLGSEYVDDTIRWRTEIPLNHNSEHYPTRGRSICFSLNDPKMQTCLSFVEKDSVFTKDCLEKFGLDRDSISLLGSLGLIVFNDERQAYHLRSPFIYPWNLNRQVISFVMEEDYCRRIYRDLDLELENPLSATGVSELILALTGTGKESVEPDLGILESLSDFSNNVISAVYQEKSTPANFEIRTSFPISLDDPRALGEILWAVDRVPRVVDLMPLDWFQIAVIKAMETTRLISATTNIPCSIDDSTAFFTSPSVAESISLAARHFGMTPSVAYDEYGRTLRFTRRDIRRLGSSSPSESTETQVELSVLGLTFEILNEVLRIRPEQTMTLEELANRLEVDLDFLWDFITTHFDRSLDLGVPGQIAPLWDPWLEIPT